MNPFRLTVLEGDHGVQIEILRLWTDDDAEAFRSELETALAHLPAKQNGSAPSILVDARNGIVHQQAVARRIQEIATDLKARKIAIVVDGALQQLQAQRLTPNANDTVFKRYHDALDWLRSDQSAAV